MSSTNKSTSTATIIISLVALAIGFSLGILYQKNKTPSLNGSQPPTYNRGTGQGLGQGNFDNTNVVKNRGQVAGFRQTVGEITSMDDKSITIKMADGSSKIVFLSDSTTIDQSVTANKADLKVGVTVAIQGDQNSDGSVTSRSIEINPHFATVTPVANQ